MPDVDAPTLIAAIFAGYVLGSTPFAVLAAWSAGVNIFRTGTGNPGAANIFRKVSRPLGAAVFALDGAKGAAGVLAARALGVPDELAVIGGAAAVTGHFVPVFWRFRGGAGLAAAIGAAAALSLVPGLISIGAGGVALIVLRSSGHAAAVLLAALAVASAVMGDGFAVIAGALGLAGMVFARKAVVNLAARRRAEAP